MTDTRRLVLLAAGCAAAAAAVYAGVLHGAFVYDDFPAVFENLTLRGHSLAAVLLYTRFRPLVNLSYALDAALFGLAPFGFHLGSVLLHAANTALAALLCDAAFRDAAEKSGTPPPRPLLRVLPALCFALHPLNTQAVAYIAARAEVLSTTFVFLSLLSLRRALRTGEARWLAAGFAALAAGLACKETAAAVPAVALAWALFLLPASDLRARRALWISLAVLAAAGIARVIAFRLEATPPRGLLENLLLEAAMLWRYAALFVFPAGQTLLHHVRELSSPADPRALLALAALGAAAVALARVRSRAPLAVFGVAWFALLLAPAALVPLLEPLSEHRAYAAGFGLCLAAASAAQELVGARGATALMSAAAIICVPLTLRRNQLWADPPRLWAEAAERSPDLWRAKYALGKQLADSGDCASAETPLRRAAKLSQSDVRAHNELARCLSAQGRTPEAYSVLDEALHRDPRSTLAREYLSRALALEPLNDARRERLQSLQSLTPAAEAPWPPSR